MARRQATGEIRVSAVPSIANKAAPTVAELDAGTVLTEAMTRGGLSTPDSGDTIDASDLASRQNKTSRGNRGGDTASITCHRDSEAAADGAWDTLHPDYDGNLVIRRFGGSDVGWAAGDSVEVWPVEVISRAMADAGDETQRFTANLSIPGQVEYEAVVAV